METIEIVQLHPDDWQAYRNIRLEALITEPRAFGSTYAESVLRPDAHWRQRLEESALGEKSWLLFARENDRLVGLIGAFVAEEPGVVDIISVYVSPAARGKGVGKALMNAILQTVSRCESIKVAHLMVNKKQTAALQLYQGCGFQKVGEEEALLGDGKWYTEYKMEKSLRSDK